MGETLYGKYLYAVGNLGENLNLCGMGEVWVYTSYNFKSILFITFCV